MDNIELWELIEDAKRDGKDSMEYLDDDGKTITIKIARIQWTGDIY